MKDIKADKIHRIDVNFNLTKKLIAIILEIGIT